MTTANRVMPTLVECPRCHAPVDEPCRNYKGQAKQACPGRAELASAATCQNCGPVPSLHDGPFCFPTCRAEWEKEQARAELAAVVASGAKRKGYVTVQTVGANVFRATVSETLPSGRERIAGIHTVIGRVNRAHLIAADLGAPVVESPAQKTERVAEELAVGVIAGRAAAGDATAAATLAALPPSEKPRHELLAVRRARAEAARIAAAANEPPAPPAKMRPTPSIPMPIANYLPTTRQLSLF